MRRKARRGVQLAKADPLERHFLRNKGRQVHKWLHYFAIYHRHFRRFRHRAPTVVEIGVSHGGSLQMWRRYFGRRARIVGVDIDPRCERFADERTEIVIGDQEDRAFLRGLRERIGPVDVLIEDGGHTMTQQIATFEELWPAVADDGVYLVEDLHTSYWDDYGGSLGGDTFIEFAKRLIDRLHAWHSDDLEVDRYTREIKGMHVYDSIIVFDKGRVTEPRAQQTGRKSH